MRRDAILSLGTVAIIALLFAGASYRSLHQVPRPASPNDRTAVARAPGPAQPSPGYRRPAGAENAAPTPAPTPAPAPPGPAAAENTAPAAPVPAPPPAPAAGPSAAPGSPVAAPAAPTVGASQPTAPAAVPALPADGEMSVANRRNVQEALQHRGYYRGPVDGVFGKGTRDAIRRFQSSIGARRTGYLSAAQANRLVSAT